MPSATPTPSKSASNLIQSMALTTLAVHDDGVGMPAAGPRNKGMGISVMQYRVRMIGGTLD